MTPRQIELVQSTWKQVVPISMQAATLFYDKLFELDPSLRELFKSDITAQKAKLMQMIGLAVGGLSNLPALVPAVQELGCRHAGYGVEDEHYDTVGAALIWTLEQGLGPALTADAKLAWIVVYTLLADTMKAAAADAQVPG